MRRRETRKIAAVVRRMKILLTMSSGKDIDLAVKGGLKPAPTKPRTEPARVRCGGV